MSSIKGLLEELKADNMLMKSDDKKEDRRRSCEKCGKTLSCHRSLWRHKKKCTSRCHQNLEPSSVKVQDDNKRRNKIPILKLKWNGSAWQRVNSCEKLYYQMKLGRDLDNLVRKRAINEDVLNATQKSYLQMYKEMFTD